MLTLKSSFRFLFPLIFAFHISTNVWAAYPYLDDANKAQSSVSSATSLNHHLFPRVMQLETMGGTSTEALSKYHFIDAHGNAFNQVKTIQANYSPETMLLRHISGRAYQSYSAKDTCSITTGIAFAFTGPVSQGGPRSSGCNIFAGHWLYKAGTTLIQPVNGSALSLRVADASKIKPGQYVVIYNGPAGSFNNAEHVKVTASNPSTDTLTLQARGYKSNAVSHGAGSIVAQHVLGQGSDSLLWAFNMSSVSPRDGNNKTFGQFYADWLQKNLKKTKSGETTGAEMAGVLFDADFYFELVSAAPDTNNDLMRDDGLSSAGVNWLGDGLDAFYKMVSDRLPGHYVLAGVHDGRGYASAHGAQMENWLDYGNGAFDSNPKYPQLNAMIVNYLFNMGARAKSDRLTHNLTKTPTRLYPGKGTRPPSNAPFRLGLALTLMDDGYFGTHPGVAPDAWWDEYAVDVTPGSPNYGTAIPKSDVNRVHQHRGWLGRPSGPFTRVYDDAKFASNQSLLYDGLFNSILGNWSSKGVKISRVITGQIEGAGALLASTMSPYGRDLSAAHIKSEAINLVAGREYTIAFSARASKYREIRVGLGTQTERLPLGTAWRRYVISFVQTKNQNSPLIFQVGRENSQVWLDSVYVFDGSANVFRRDFENGIAVANATPRSRTINLGSNFLRIQGAQDAAINNGAKVSTVTLAPYDGLLLVRPDGAQGGGGGGGGGSGGAGIGDFVWNDSDGDGIHDAPETGMPGVSVRLLNCQGSQLASVSTGTGGGYAFDNLAAGSYRIKFVAPSGTKISPQRKGTKRDKDSNPSPATGMTECMPLSANQYRTGIDAGIIGSGGSGGSGGGSGGGGGGGGDSGSASIGNLVWNDADGDGNQDAGESGLAGVSVGLLSCGGTWLAGTSSSRAGIYEFENLAAGRYRIKFVAPRGAQISPRRRGASRGHDSNPHPATGMTDCMSLTATKTRTGIDAGIDP